MGYNAEKTDPLYKIIPYYLTLNSHTKEAYGLFYNTYSSGIIDFGSEIDALWVCLSSHKREIIEFSRQIMGFWTILCFMGLKFQIVSRYLLL